LSYLLDTHTLVWWLLNENKLSVRARNAIASSTGPIFVSAVSAFEIATKVRLGKFEAAREIDADFVGLVRADGFMLLDVHTRHALAAGRLVLAHRDPFDRLLAAQAMAENLTLVTRDPAFSSFDVPTLW
jgi:PIN domain nuclease of toxin-antitoxin system